MVIREILDTHERFSFYHTTPKENVLYWRIGRNVVCLVESTSSSETRVETAGGMTLVFFNPGIESAECVLKLLESAFDKYSSDYRLIL